MAREFQLKALIMGVDKLSPALARARKNALNFRRGLLNSGLGKPISLTSLMQGGAFAAPFVAASKAAIDFESSMADVRKVVDFDTPEQFAEMGKDIVAMSTRLPMAAKDIAAIVAAGGQSGLAREELGRFAEDAVKMGIAFDQTAEQSGDMMAKWRTSFKMGQTEVVALADKINYLSNNGAATAQQISAIVTRIGPLGEVAGLAAGEIAAMGSTLAGIGVSEEQAATGLKNFMLAMTSGKAATKTQQQIFKALRMDAQQVAAGMQKDAKGTMLKVLDAIGRVDATKQAGVLQQLFGKESITAIAPLLTNLDKLKETFAMVADETQYAGSMNKEYEARSQTTANAIQLLWNRIMALGVTVGNVLLPPLNDFLMFAGPLVDQVTALAGAHPWLIKGVLGAAAGFVALRLAVAGTAMAIKVMTAATQMSPIGLLVRGIALAAGFLIANWETVGPWFADLWERVKAPAVAIWDWFKNAFLNWTPLGLIIQNWEPIVQWFSDLWDRVSKFIEPIVNGVASVKGAVSGTIDTATNAASDSWSWIKGKFGFGDDEQAPAGTAPGAAPITGRDPRLEGELVVRFEGAPPGMRAEPLRTNQPGLRTRQDVGVRSLAGAY